MRRRVRVLGTLVLTAAAVAYLVWKIDLGTTLDVLSETSVAWFVAAAAIMVLTVPVLAARWDALLRAHGIHERLPWLTRAYFVAYTAGQILPTALGGDAVRILETARRHAGRTAAITGTVVLERGLGGAATVLLGAAAFLLSIGRYDVSAYLWLEGLFVFGTILLAFLFFARSARPLLRRTQPLLERVRLAKPLRAFYESVHHYRERPRLLLAVVGVSASRSKPCASSRSGRAAQAVGIDLGVIAYYVMGPLLFLVMLVPFTLNGIAVREAFFVSFLGSLGVGADAGLRGRVPLLPRHGRHGAARRDRSRLGGRSGRSAPAGRAWLTTSRSSSSRTTRSPGSSSAWRACAASRRSSSTTARATGRSPSCARRFPEVRVIESENRGLGAGWNIGLRETESRYALLLNADAWLVGDALSRLVEFGRQSGRARPSSAPACRTRTGRFSAPCADFPTLWRLATEYFFLRKLAPGTSALNAFYAGGFDHDEVREVEVVMGSCMLVRREAVSEVGNARRGLLPLQRGDRLVLPLPRGGLAGRLLPGRRVRARARGLARRPPLPREPARTPAVHLEAPGRAAGEPRAPPAPRRPSPPRARLSRGSRRAPTGRPRTGSRPAT